MIRQIPVREDKIFAFRLSGKLGHADYQAFLSQLEELIKVHGRISVLLELADFYGWKLDAALDGTGGQAFHQSRRAILQSGAIGRGLGLVARTTPAGCTGPDTAGPVLEHPGGDRFLGSAHSMRAVHRALDLAHRHGGRVTLVHAEALCNDLSVLGTHGHHGIARLSGSTANAVSHNTRCGVLTVQLGATT